MTNIDTHDVIEMIYKADGSLETLEALLDALAELWGAQWITLGQVDLHSGTGVTSGSARYRKLMRESYADLSRIRHDFREIYRQAPVYSRILGQDTFLSPVDVLGSTALSSHLQDWLEEWRALQGSGTFLTSVFNCQKQRQEILVVSFEDGVSEVRLERLKSQTFWLRHLAAAQNLRNERPANSDRITALETVLDELVWGVVIVGADSKVFLSNSAAQRLMESWPGVYIHDDKLNLPESFQMKDGAGAAAQDAMDTTDATSLRVMESPEADNMLLMYAKPLRAGGLGGLLEGDGTAFFFHDMRSQDKDCVDVARRVYGLTEAEAACMTLFMEGATRSEVAERRGVSLETIRSQASSIIRKTGSQNMSGAIVQCLHLNPPVAKRR